MSMIFKRRKVKVFQKKWRIFKRRNAREVPRKGIPATPVPSEALIGDDPCISSRRGLRGRSPQRTFKGGWRENLPALLRSW